MTITEFKDLTAQMKKYLPKEKHSQVREAYRYAAACHEGQTRESGGPYIEHPISTALFLAGLRLDAATLSAALLHDVVEDCGITFDELAKEFGADVAKLVDGVTKLTRMELTDRIESPGTLPEDLLKAETLRKMLVAMAEDVRVVLIKLADRLHNMKTLGALPMDRQQAIAQETLDIYAPLAHRLGIWDIKWRLEDMAFHCLEPARYLEITEMLSARMEEREAYISEIRELLIGELEKVKLEAQVIGRPKHVYSIHRKTAKYADLGKQMSDIYDLYAIRLTVKSQSECYQALGVVHNLWRPIPGQFDDYIANPKENLYQGIHTTVMCRGATPLEVQIRTTKMHELAEYGVAAHWRYKEGSAGDVQFEHNMTWLRQLLEWQREVKGTEEFLESVKTDFFRDQVFTYSPKGDLVELPAGATPIDFAYRIHTELGHRCIGSKVNGSLTSLDYQLRNGDTVEVLTAKVARGPSLDWLNPNLGYVRTAGARSSIRQWFRQQRRSTNIKLGGELLRKEAHRLNMRIEEASLASVFGYGSADQFLFALGSGGITINQIMSRLSEVESSSGQASNEAPLVNSGPTNEVVGIGNMLSQIGRCCNPLPGDDIIGLISRSKGVTVHNKMCSTVIRDTDQNRKVDVQWSHGPDLYPVRIEIRARDRVGLLNDVAHKVSEEGVNIASVVTTENYADGFATISLTLHTTGLDQLGRLFAKLDGIRGVASASRITDDVLPHSVN